MTASVEKLNTPSSWTACFGTEVNSLASGNSVQSTVPIVNGTTLDMFMDVSFELGSVITTGSPYLALGLFPLLQDGAKYGSNQFGSSASGMFPFNYLVGFAGLPVGTQSLYGDFSLPGRRSAIVIPPGSFVLVLYNGSNVNLASSGNTIKERRFNRQVGS